jgi:hypothetical protein
MDFRGDEISNRTVVFQKLGMTGTKMPNGTISVHLLAR